MRLIDPAGAVSSADSVLRRAPDRTVPLDQLNRHCARAVVFRGMMETPGRSISFSTLSATRV